MGMPQVNNTFTPSRYKDGAFELRGYNETLPDIMPSDDEINYYGQPLNWDEFEGFNTLKPMDDFVMGRHTVKSNSDERGSYIEYIDEFDFDTYKYKTDVGFPLTDTKLDINIPVGDMLDKTFGKPYSIYGRKYYKDYGDGVNRAMYYTDSELSDNTADKDTLGLQRELRNRGYEFPGSTKENGTLDGVMGDETKKALAEYQASQIKTKK